MKVCQFLASGDTGGLAKHLIDLTGGMSEFCTISVIAPASMKATLAKGVLFCPVDFSSGPVKSILSIYRMLRFIKKTDPDVLCSHGSKAAKILSYLKPHVRAVCIGTLHWIEKKKKYFERLDGVVGVSKAALDGLNLKTSRVIYNGVNTSNVIEPNTQKLFDSLRLQKDKPVAIAIGRMVKVKGYGLLISAWKDIDANLLLVGDGPLKNELEIQVQENQLNHKVFMVGHVDEAHQLIKKADLVVISSLHEGFCYVLAEALRYRVPVVSTDVAAANEILPDKLLSPTDNMVALRENLNAQLQRLPELNEDLAGLFDWAEKALSVKYMVDNTIQFYSDVIKEKR